MKIRALAAVLRPPSIPKYTQKEKDALRKKAASKYCRGNIGLQKRQFLTEAERTELRNDVLNEQF